MKNTPEIRKIFLNFFSKKNHKILDSSSLIAEDDKTLLFTNSGMHQFKNIFLGLEKIQHPCIATAQRCMRAGGKHNDLDVVGKTGIHHTFFEMLGNFSFGAYSKVEAIQFAWELLTDKKWFNLPKEKLLVTVYYKDIISYDIWINKTNINPNHVIFIKDKNNKPYHSDNFWTMGDFGPCGPCSEIFYCFNKIYTVNDTFLKNHCIEIWNLVFMQFNLQVNGELSKLPKFAIDTGMGLERISSVLQKVNSNYDIDLFQKIIKSIFTIIKIKNLDLISYRIIADHIRATVFLIYDNVLPSNSGRGYVLRKIMRRAILHGNMNLKENYFFYKLVIPVIQIMSYIDIKLKEKQNYIKKIVKSEEKLFLCSVKTGMQFLNQELIKIQNNTLSGKIIFKIYDTYGIPLNLIQDICRKKNIFFDQSGFSIAMQIQKNRSQKSSYFKNIKHYISNNNETVFCGYSDIICTTKIIAIYNEKTCIKQIQADQEGIIILDKTPFYAESGGQIGDSGLLKSSNGTFNVIDTKKNGNVFIHIGKMIYGKFDIGDIVAASIDQEKRLSITLNHSAIHLLHTTLHRILGNTAMQRGSLVKENYLSLDFTYYEKMNTEKIHNIEDMVNVQIRKNLTIRINHMSLNDALKIGAIALFKKNYCSQVRVIKIGNFSNELCGGTHVQKTGEIGCFIIVSEKKIASGVHRIKAVTGKYAIQFLQKKFDLLNSIQELMQSDASNLFEKIKQMQNNLKSQRKKIFEFNNIKIKNCILDIRKNIKVVNETKIIIDFIKISLDASMLRLILNKLKENLKNSIIVLAIINKNQVKIAVSVAKETSRNIQASDIIDYFKKFNTIKGGGNAYFAEASGILNPIDLQSTFKKIFVILSKKL
ncbi:alanyl-tRNA synthetase [Wigglesworthia glossinidia endosymbiont of Glossina morsitans morsitans (Yale colony)]|uniref:Alanine--tRNA ligase n=1 Tax=Wigglesworthia glossinidia endosymbiont of Glossina morsitans morsitans (Yale colony) TaxID=1142511 RepID=H6Q583_WIGGL|nr:alanine--tRNA ligase [Wigglesworthia glossinidia]AFA41366.1 alanyl-tRNA synthetase [Wigglesworthia glossinidia endosymbiont of Glossina morsitans morsitans (Yale colony)]